MAMNRVHFGLNNTYRMNDVENKKNELPRQHKEREPAAAKFNPILCAYHRVCIDILPFTPY